MGYLRDNTEQMPQAKAQGRKPCSLVGNRILGTLRGPLLLTLAMGLLGCESGFLGLSAKPPKLPVEAREMEDDEEIDDDTDPGTNPGLPVNPNAPVPPAVVGPVNTGVPSPSPSPAALCNVTVDCSGNRVNINYDCMGEGARKIDSPLAAASCDQIKLALSGKGLPTGKTVETPQGGPTCAVECEGGGSGVMRTRVNIGASFTMVQLGFTMPDVVCIEMRNIINALKL